MQDQSKDGYKRQEQDRSIEGKNLKKEVTSSIPLWDGESMDCWSFEGEGEVEIREKGVLHLHTWSRADHWPDTEVRACLLYTSTPSRERFPWKSPTHGYGGPTEWENIRSIR